MFYGLKIFFIEFTYFDFVQHILGSFIKQYDKSKSELFDKLVQAQ